MNELEIAKALVSDLAMYPDRWKFDKDYDATRNNGVVVWLSNSYYGLEVKYKDAKIGGVTSSSSLFGRFIPWRRKLYDAFIAERNRRKTAPMKSIMEALAE